MLSLFLCDQVLSGVSFLLFYAGPTVTCSKVTKTIASLSLTNTKFSDCLSE